MSKDEEIRRVAMQLDTILDQLRDNVDALNEILTRPSGGDEADERLVAP
jgi:chaperonin cofactor prefoldin